MFNYIFRNFGHRILFAILLAWPASLLLEIIFSLQYEKYIIYQDLSSYLYTVLAIYLFSEAVMLLNQLLDRKFHWHQSPVRRLSWQFLIQFLVALAIVTGGRVMVMLIFGTTTYILLIDEITIAMLTFFLVLILNMVDFGIVMLNQWRYSLAEVEKYKKESAEFEFEMLRAQVNPHFLFNSLNTLSSLIYEDPDRASDFIRKLSDVYRHVLDNRKKELIQLTDEIDFVKAYIYLLELRFSEKLNVSISMKPELSQRMIAPLTLQMLLENAVKHNVVSADKPLKIEIYDEDDYIVIRNVLQLKKEKTGSTGMGLQNIRSRYEVICDRPVIILEDNGTFTVKVPLI
jgi:two-component system LytT family sensor kinase